MKMLQLISVMLFALVTGVFWGTWFSLSRSMDTITAATFLDVGKIDYDFVSWTVDTLPGDWRATRSRWEFFHGMRTLLSIAALACLVGSVLVTRNRRGIARVVNRAAA